MRKMSGFWLRSLRRGRESALPLRTAKHGQASVAQICPVGPRFLAVIWSGAVGLVRSCGQALENSSAPFAGLIRSSRLDLLCAGLRGYEILDSPGVMRVNEDEFHADPFFTFRPADNSFRADPGQVGWLAKDQVKLSADGEYLFRKEAEPCVAQVFGFDNVISLAIREDDRQSGWEPWRCLATEYDGHDGWPLRMGLPSPLIHSLRKQSNHQTIDPLALVKSVG